MPGSVTGPSVAHHAGRELAVSVGDVELLRYAYRPRVPAAECPMPYLHPVRTLAGDVVTGHRPHDHRWHKGLAMTVSHLSGQNFWGGGTYVPGAPGHGYLDLPNVGAIEHRRFTVPPATGPVAEGAEAVRIVQELDWQTSARELWLDERRTIVVRDVEAADRSWALDFTTELTSVHDQPLEFASPTVFGRELAGYSGLFWRGPRSFVDGEVLAAGGQAGPRLMGQQASWLAYVGAHDEVDRHSTVLFMDCPDNTAAPTRWFVRTTPYPVVNPSLAFFDPVTLLPGQTLRLRYRVVFCDGSWDHERIERYVRRHPW